MYRVSALSCGMKTKDLAPSILLSGFADVRAKALEVRLQTDETKEIYNRSCATSGASHARASENLGSLGLRHRANAEVTFHASSLYMYGLIS